jgi:hypothetical protein
MLLSITIPHSLTRFESGVVRAIHVGSGAEIEPGSMILDFSVDLSAGPSTGCPPVAHYRIVSAEKGSVHTVHVAVGQEIGPTTILGLLNTGGEPAEGEPVRAARMTAASILRTAVWWDEL